MIWENYCQWIKAWNQVNGKYWVKVNYIAKYITTEHVIDVFYFSSCGIHWSITRKGSSQFAWKRGITERIIQIEGILFIFFSLIFPFYPLLFVWLPLLLTCPPFFKQFLFKNQFYPFFLSFSLVWSCIVSKQKYFVSCTLQCISIII